MRNSQVSGEAARDLSLPLPHFRTSSHLLCLLFMISPRWRACLQATFLLTFIFSFQLPAAVGEAPTFGFTEHMANKFFKPEGVRSLTYYLRDSSILLILATKIFPLIGYNFCIPLGNLMKSEIQNLIPQLDAYKMYFKKLIIH